MEYLNLNKTNFSCHVADNGYYFDYEAVPIKFNFLNKDYYNYDQQESIRSLEKIKMLSNFSNANIRLSKMLDNNWQGPKLPFIVMDPEFTSFYEIDILKDNPILFKEFTELSTDEQILKFANKYGMLTNGEAVIISPKQKGGNYRTQLSLISHKGISLVGVPAESISFWHKEIAAMKLAVKLYELVENQDIDYLNEIIYWKGNQTDGFEVYYEYNELETSLMNPNDLIYGDLSRPSYKSRYERPIINPNALIYSNDIEVISKLRANFGNPYLPARLLINELVNEKLAFSPVIPILRIGDKNESESYHMPSNLLSFMWFQFYQAVVGAIKYRQCEICGLSEDITYKSKNWRKHPECSNRDRAKRAYERKKANSIKTLKKSSQQMGSKSSVSGQKTGKTD